MAGVNSLSRTLSCKQAFNVILKYFVLVDFTYICWFRRFKNKWYLKYAYMPYFTPGYIKPSLTRSGWCYDQGVTNFFRQCYSKMSMTFVSGRQRQEATQQTVQSVSNHLIWSSTSEESFFFSFIEDWTINVRLDFEVRFLLCVCVRKGFYEQDKNHLQDNEPLG